MSSGLDIGRIGQGENCAQASFYHKMNGPPTSLRGSSSRWYVLYILCLLFFTDLEQVLILSNPFTRIRGRCRLFFIQLFPLKLAGQCQRKIYGSLDASDSPSCDHTQISCQMIHKSVETNAADSPNKRLSGIVQCNLICHYYALRFQSIDPLAGTSEIRRFSLEKSK